MGTRPLSRRGGDRTVPHQQVAAHSAFGVMHDPGRFRVRLAEQGVQTSRSARTSSPTVRDVSIARRASSLRNET